MITAAALTFLRRRPSVTCGPSLHRLCDDARDLRIRNQGHDLQLPYKKYTQEYKDEAVELVISSGRPIAEIARDLGINEGTLANWVNTARKSGKVKEKPLDTDERARLRELEEENRRLKMERDFLKKAAAWFAKENQ